ncbi:hypothetical protein RJT34_15349 [Clitoria ternatea]|uniref:Ubiquitin-like domain-containing protein n=1 Tax=Clitoria ternatea TaxID=43366 RepID=A0AAN9JUL2_CLITE
MSESNHKQIEIRALTGESITVPITPTTTIQHLKLVLNHSFPPATNSPNFHLFFKAHSPSFSLTLHFHHQFLNNLILLTLSFRARNCDCTL